MNNNGSSSTIIARHDYLPFGEEIWSGTGLRTGAQGYGATDAIRQKYGLTERDDATGLDHTWWRKYESFAGRLTSPDPYTGSMTTADPQSFNRYSYVQNDPVNFVDPSGLYAACVHEAMTKFLARLAGYGNSLSNALGRYAGDKPGGADSPEYAATSPWNAFLGFFGTGPSADIHFPSEEKLQQYKASFRSNILSGYIQRAAFTLHAIEDAHGAHQGFSLPLGHSYDPGVDFIIGDEKFSRAANEVYQVLTGKNNAHLSAQQFKNLVNAIMKGCGKNAGLQIVHSGGLGHGGGGGGSGGGGGGGGGYYDEFTLLYLWWDAYKEAWERQQPQ